MEISPEQLQTYRATARRRAQEKRRKQQARTSRAWTVAREAAALLKDVFGASRVVVFGSLAAGRPLSVRSDIDLAAWDLPDEQFYYTVAKLQDISREFSIDLVDMGHCPSSLREAILTEGKEL